MCSRYKDFLLGSAIHTLSLPLNTSPVVRDSLHPGGGGSLSPKHTFSNPLILAGESL